ncbi:hypothetical protein [Agrobacterium sp. 22-226-1]
MKKTALFSFGAGALLLAAIPLAGMAQDQNTGASPTEDNYGCQRSVAYRNDFPGIRALADRLDDLRYYYTGKAIRFRLAGMLSAQETAIGVRADQKDAWRAYTEALLALVPDREAIISVLGAPDDDPKGPKAFGRAEALSDVMAGYADKAQALNKAIMDLRAKLTPEQLETARMPRLIPR